MISLTMRHVSRDLHNDREELAVTSDSALQPHLTAVVICDMWDKHWCSAATRRVAEMAPRLNEVVMRLRDAGALIIHAPSDTVEWYGAHPARQAALVVTPIDHAGRVSPSVHHDLRDEAALPIDDTDGGCGCSPRCEPCRAWTRQTPEIEISEADVICDDRSVFGVYAERGIKNVVIAGVHTNMCVLGRPFGIRESVRRGLNVMLVRDLTDTMYNPAQRPWVDHFTGTDLVVRHIERYWCPTITSDQIVGGKPFRFSEDTRPNPYTA